MKLGDKRLAAENLGLLVSYGVAEDYEARREMLNGSLGSTDIETSPEEAKENVDLLISFLGKLPISWEKSNGVIRPIVETPADVRATQSSFLWTNRDMAKGVYLIAGSRRESTFSQSVLLIGYRHNLDSGLGVYKESIGHMRFSKIAKIKEKIYNDGLTSNEASYMHHEGSGGYAVASHASLEGTDFNGHSSITRLDALSNFDLARYNVFDHLAEAALKFGKTTKLMALWNSDQEKDPSQAQSLIA